MAGLALGLRGVCVCLRSGECFRRDAGCAVTHGGRPAKPFGCLRLEGGLAVPFRFVLLRVTHPLIVKPLLKGLWAPAGSGRSGGSAGLGSSSGSGGLAPTAAGLQWQPAAPGPVLWQCLGAVEKPAPSLHPSPGRHGAAWEPAGPCPAPSAFPQSAAVPQPGRLWAAGVAEGKGKAAPVTPPGVLHGTRHSSSCCLPKQLCCNNWRLCGRWFTFLSRTLRSTVLPSASRRCQPSGAGMAARLASVR